MIGGITMSSKFIKLTAISAILIVCYVVSPGYAILNCLTPQPFGKMKMPAPAWYPPMPPNAAASFAGPSLADPQMSPYMPMQSPLKNFFQSKWRPLFGGIKAGNQWAGSGSWKMGAPGGFYRPFSNNVFNGYSGSTMLGNHGPGIMLPSELNIAPMSLPGQGLPVPTPGWSVPISQTSLPNYEMDSAFVNGGGYATGTNQQLQQPQTANYNTKPANLIVDPYKPANIVPSGTKTQQTTRKWYDFFKGSRIGGTSVETNDFDDFVETQTIKKLGYDSNVVSGRLQDPKLSGYSYPKHYYTVPSPADSPSRVFQQLKYNLRLQQLNQDPYLTSSLRQSVLLSQAGEPKFDGFGYIENTNHKEARLRCSFSKSINQLDRPLWIKFIGNYRNTTLNGTSSLERLGELKAPTFNCQTNTCRTQEIEKDYRYHFENDSKSSTLIISEPRVDDYGFYRCSTIVQTGNIQSPLETIYQIVEFKPT